VNPGNFADGRKDFDDHVYETEEDYVKERSYLYEAMLPLVKKCKELNRAMRIGTNHGSLSSRVLSFYGDTPRGMVEVSLRQRVRSSSLFLLFGLKQLTLERTLIPEHLSRRLSLLIFVAQRITTTSCSA